MRIYFLISTLLRTGKWLLSCNIIEPCSSMRRSIIHYPTSVTAFHKLMPPQQAAGGCGLLHHQSLCIRGGCTTTAFITHTCPSTPRNNHRLYSEGPQDPSTASVYTPPPTSGPIKQAANGEKGKPDIKALLSLVIGEIVLGFLAIPIGHLMNVNPLATLSFQGLPRTFRLGFLLTFPALCLHKASGQTIDEMLKSSLDMIFGDLISKCHKMKICVMMRLQ